MYLNKLMLIGSFLFLMFTSCEKVSENKENPFTPRDIPKTSGSAILNSTQKSQLMGHISFHPEIDRMKITAVLKNMKPGRIGLFLHKFGICTQDGKAAGPLYMKPGATGNTDKLMGYLGEVNVDNDGNSNFVKFDTLLSTKGEFNVLGRSVLIKELSPSGNKNQGDHLKPDSLKILGCGIIGLIAE